MNKKIGYVTFGKDEYGYGLALCIHKNNIVAHRASIKTAKEFDIILFSIFWWEHVYKFVDFCHKAGIGNTRKKPEVIVGGFNSFNPWAFMPWAHKVIVGDGENVIQAAIDDKPHESIFTGKEKSVVYAQADVRENDFNYENPHNEITRIEIARGCKYKCPFCQMTHLKKYREVSKEAVMRAIDNSQYKRAALFAPNGVGHSDYKQIMDYAESKKSINIASDVRYNELEKYRNPNTARMGIEGISARLRKLNKKPLSSAKFKTLIERRMAQCQELGYKPSLHTYFILDLPTESQNDWNEFIDFIWSCNDIKGIEDFTWIFTANVFMPCPHTPYEDEVIHIDRDYAAKWDSALRDKSETEVFKYTVGGRKSIFSPYSRLVSMVATRCGPDDAELIFNIATNKKLKKFAVGGWKKSLDILVKFIDNNYGGINRFVGKPEKHWKIVKIN
jgi:radical SAM superfamily enzyme YgiQ (UPF0313 family)